MSLYRTDDDRILDDLERDLPPRRFSQPVDTRVNPPCQDCAALGMVSVSTGDRDGRHVCAWHAARDGELIGTAATDAMQQAYDRMMERRRT